MSSKTEKKAQKMRSLATQFPSQGILPDSKHFVSCKKVSVSMNTEAEFGYAQGRAFVVHYKIEGFAPHGGFEELPKNFKNYPVIYQEHRSV